MKANISSEDDLNKSLKQLNQIYVNYSLFSIVSLENVSIDNVKKFLQIAETLIKKVVDSSECKVIINLSFEEIFLEKNESEHKYLFEKLTYIIFTIVNHSKFVYEKNIIVNCRNKDYNIKELNKYSEKDVINISVDLKNLDLNSDFQLSDFSLFMLEHYFPKNIKNDISDLENQNLKTYDVIALGGSFDHIHFGHKLMILKGILNCNKKLSIGITSDEMISKKCHLSAIQPFNFRKQAVLDYINEINFKNLEIEIYEINDRLGRAAKNPDLQALVLTIETLVGGDMVNTSRLESNLKKVEFILVDLVVDDVQTFKQIINLKSYDEYVQSKAKKVSSSEIRKTQEFSKEKLLILYDMFKSIMSKIIEDEKDCNNVSVYWFSKIRDYYSQTWRKYHNLNHIYDYLSKFNEVHKLFSDQIDYINCCLTIWFHDIIYTPSRPDNEERSIEIFNDFFENMESYNSKVLNKKKVNDYILGTKFHFKSDYSTDIFELNLLLDIDISSMADENKSKNDEVNSNILFEFSHHFDKITLYTKRIEFLKMTLLKDQLFRTDYYKKFNDFAKENNKRLIQQDSLILENLLKLQNK